MAIFPEQRGVLWLFSKQRGACPAPFSSWARALRAWASGAGGEGEDNISSQDLGPGCTPGLVISGCRSRKALSPLIANKEIDTRPKFHSCLKNYQTVFKIFAKREILKPVKATRAPFFSEAWTGLPILTKLARNPLVHLSLIALAACLAYANSFSVPFVFDDDTHIKYNLLIQDVRFLADPSLAKGIGLNHYYFLRLRYVSLLSFALDYRLHGLNPSGYHLTNLIIHLINASLVYGLIKISFTTPLLSQSVLQRYGSLIAFFTALLFAVHPIQTQAVTYIAQRQMSLATLFYLLSLYLYVKWRLASLAGAQAGARDLKSLLVGLYVLSLGVAVLGMKTKEICVTLPVAIGLYEFLFFQGKVLKRMMFIIPYLVTTFIIPLSLMTLVDLRQPLGEILTSVSHKSFIFTPVSSGDYLLTQFTVLVTYLRLLVLPINQNLDYDYPIYHSFLAPTVFLSFALLAAILALAVYLLYAYREREPGVRLVAFGIFFFFLALAVESSIMPMIDVINEHRLYLAAAGFFAALTTGIFLGVSRWEGRWPALPGLAILLLLVLAGGYGVATHRRNQVWQSELHLWEDVVKKSPGKARAYIQLGYAYAHQGQYNRAIPFYQQAIALNPGFAPYYSDLSIAYLNVGDTEKAMQMAQKALQVNPKSAYAYNNLGVLYLRQGEMERAAAMFNFALRINPGDANAHANLQLIQKRKKP
jgi:tetratricopeptide (TPR) repeat protein